MNLLGRMLSLIALAIFVLVPYTGVVAQPYPTNQPPVAEFYWLPDQPCAGKIVRFDGSRSYDPESVNSGSGPGIRNYEWYRVNAASTASGLVATGPVYETTFPEAGNYSVKLTVYDGQGNPGSITKTVPVVKCADTTTASPSPASGTVAKIEGMAEVCLGHRALFNDRSLAAANRTIVRRAWYVNGGLMSDTVQFYYAHSAAGSYELKLIVSDSAGETQTAILLVRVVDCAAGTSPAPTSQPSNAEYCKSLYYKRQAWISDWEYRYSQARQVNNSTEMNRLTAQRQEFESSYQAEWERAGCASGGTTAGEACRSAFASAEPEFQALKSRYEMVWGEYFSALEHARRNFSASGYHNDTEWKEFEAVWSARAHEIQSRFMGELVAIVEKYHLRECGWQDYQYQPRPAVEAQYTEAPPPMDEYSLVRVQCEERMIAVKNEYAPRFEALFQRLHGSPPDSADYAAVRAEISALEQEVTRIMGAIAHECRALFQAQYDAPENFREGVGSLQCYFDAESKRILCEGKYVSFQGHPDTQVLYRYTCGGQLFFDELYANTVFEDFSFSEGEEGARLAIRSSNLKMIFHDGPRGVINVGVLGDVSVSVVPALHLRVTVEGNKVLLESPDARGVWIGGEDALSWDELSRVLTIHGEATWVAETCVPDGSKPDGSEDAKYWEAIRQRRLGAQVVIHTEGDDDVRHDDETYDEGMEVRVHRERGDRYQAFIDFEEGTCQTVVLKFDTSIFSTIKLRVVLNDNETGAEIVIQEAENLEDVLDPCNDGPDTFEYWIVADRLGTQVIVSFAHFSEKRVTVEAAAVGNLVVPGFSLELFLLSVGLVAAAVFVMRRRTTR